mgnify:CR=1 FL=1
MAAGSPAFKDLVATAAHLHFDKPARDRVPVTGGPRPGLVRLRATTSASAIAQADRMPDQWRKVLDHIAEANAEGKPVITATEKSLRRPDFDGTCRPRHE